MSVRGGVTVAGFIGASAGLALPAPPFGSVGARTGLPRASAAYFTLLRGGGSVCGRGGGQFALGEAISLSFKAADSEQLGKP